MTLLQQPRFTYLAYGLHTLQPVQTDESEKMSAMTQSEKMSAAAQSEKTSTAAQSARPSRAFSITSVIAG